ncbi:MAG: hypothetical protein K2Y22_04015 [Candidatus Obscuribacterales bacterium]|nr:hypothetical protein [Candidatus Obscuribacterales bacterium]
MTIIFAGYNPQSNNQIDEAREWKLFCDNIQQIIKHEKDIFACGEYFFCRPAFARYSLAYSDRATPLVVGYLLLAWRNDWLTGTCPKCCEKVLVTSFAGSFLSGSNRWTGLCVCCQCRQRGSWESDFRKRLSCMSNLGRLFPSEVTYLEKGSEHKPEDARRPVRKLVAIPVTLGVLIEELRTGAIRRGSPPNVRMLKDQFRFKFFNRVRHPVRQPPLS